MMRYDDAGLPGSVREGEATVPTADSEAWQQEHLPTLTVRVWLTVGGRQLINVSWEDGLPQRVAARDHEALHEMSEAAAAAVSQLEKVLWAVTLAHEEHVILEGVTEKN